MIFTQQAVGLGAFTLIGATILNLFGDITAPSGPNIVVHSLSYDSVEGEPYILQHRTVSAENAIFARWSAKITHNGAVVCEGAGAWDYASGEKSAAIPLDEWVGEAGCYRDKMQRGLTYQAAASYKWGDGNTATQTSTGFMKE